MAASCAAGSIVTHSATHHLKPYTTGMALYREASRADHFALQAWLQRSSAGRPLRAPGKKSHLPLFSPSSNPPRDPVPRCATCLPAEQWGDGGGPAGGPGEERLAPWQVTPLIMIFTYLPTTTPFFLPHLKPLTINSFKHHISVHAHVPTKVATSRCTVPYCIHTYGMRMYHVVIFMHDVVEPPSQVKYARIPRT